MFNILIIFLLCTVLLLQNILKYIADVYYSFVVSTIVISIITCLLVTKLPIETKIGVISAFIYLYKSNISLTSSTILTIYKEGYINKLTDRKDDEKLRAIVQHMFSRYFNLKVDITRLPDIPTIIVCNYCTDRLENLSCILIPKNMAIVMRNTLTKVSKLDKLIQWPLYTKSKNSYNNTMNEVNKHIKEGRSVFSYVTTTPKLGVEYIKKVRSGMFKIAKELNVPITLVAIDYIESVFGMIPRQNFSLLVGETFMVSDIQHAIYKTQRFFRHSMRKFKNNKYS